MRARPARRAACPRTKIEKGVRVYPEGVVPPQWGGGRSDGGHHRDRADQRRRASRRPGRVEPEGGRMTSVFGLSHKDGKAFARTGGHEQVVFCSDERSGLYAIIAIHSTALGPSLGGTRFYPYASEEEAL